jgi:Putative MetA-pathway of phenol degradation
MIGHRFRVCLALVFLLVTARAGLACDSTGCLMVTRSAGGLLPRKGFRLDLSFRSTDDSTLMNGSNTTNYVLRPKIDFEDGLVRPGFHQDLGGKARFLQLDLAYGLTGHTTLVTSAPIFTDRSYEIGHPPVLTEQYDTSGIGDTLVGVRHALVAQPSWSLVAGAGLEMPTGDYRLVAPAALFDVGVLDPMLQPGSGSWDVLLNLQSTRRLTTSGLDMTGALSYQINTTNPLDYSFGDDAIASVAVAHPFGTRVRGSMQVKWTHRGRSTYKGVGVESTGGTIVYAIPGLVVPLPARLSFYFYLPVPLYRYVNETQVAPHLSLVTGLARTF